MVSGSAVIIGNIVKFLLKESTKAGWKKLARKERMIRVCQAMSLPISPTDHFDSIYSHAVIEYCLEKEKPVLEFFRSEEIKNAFEKAFQNDDRIFLQKEAEQFIHDMKIGDDLKGLGDFDLVKVLESFALVFHNLVRDVRSPVQTSDRGKLDKIFQMIESRDPIFIRKEQIRLQQGSLSDQLKQWFRTLGYCIGESEEITDSYIQWTMSIISRSGLSNKTEKILVRFTEKQPDNEDIRNFYISVNNNASNQGWFVAAHRSSPSAEEQAEKYDGKIICKTLDELFDIQADFSKYFDWLETYVKERKIGTDYVSLGCRRNLYDRESKKTVSEERYEKADGWIEGYMDRWLDDPCQEHVSILGEFGTGKTWFTHYYAYQKMMEYNTAKKKGLKRPRLPIVIHLRDYSRAPDIKSLFSDFFFRKHEIPLPGYSAFEQLNRMGRLLLIFDGFDEMADKLDRQKMIDHFWELAKVVVPGSKVILTCRTEHFPNAMEGRRILNAELKASTKNLTGEPPQFEIVELLKFEREQIKKVLLTKTDKRTAGLILENETLMDLAGRPVLLRFIIESIPEIKEGKRIDLSRIYLYAVTKQLGKNTEQGRTFTSLADKLFFLCELSWEMIVNKHLSLNYRAFPEKMKNLFGDVVSAEKDLDHWRFDMMKNTLLTRNDDGDYKPAHKSFIEFFAAIKGLAELGFLPEDFTQYARLRMDIGPERQPENYAWNDYFTRRRINGVVQPMASLNRFVPEKREVVLQALAKMENAVLQFTHEIINYDASVTGLHQLLANLLDEFKSGKRDPETDQDLIRLIYRFRQLSQEWEEETLKVGQQAHIKEFWKEYHERETKASQMILKQDTLKKAGIPEFNLIQIPAGSFIMGDHEEGIRREKIDAPFLMAETLVTQELYKAVTQQTPSHFKGKKRPVESVSWFDALDFCNQLSDIFGYQRAYIREGEKVDWIRQNNGFRLPLETEWEYACRAGTTGRFSSGDSEEDALDIMWFEDNSNDQAREVKLKPPNTFGLYDMHGNVWEWIWDPYPDKSVNRVLRGGSWSNSAAICRSAIRIRSGPSIRYGNFGFRLSRSL